MAVNAPEYRSTTAKKGSSMYFSIPGLIPELGEGTIHAVNTVTDIVAIPIAAIMVWGRRLTSSFDHLPDW